MRRIMNYRFARRLALRWAYGVNDISANWQIFCLARNPLLWYNINEFLLAVYTRCYLRYGAVWNQTRQTLQEHN